MNIRLFLTPPDTTGVTQLLDQLNKNIHYKYRVTKENMFKSTEAINKEAFMIILANIWGKWESKESIVKAARVVGVTSTGLNVEGMQQDKFERAANLLELSSIEESPSDSSLLIPSPDKRRNSAEYWKPNLRHRNSLSKK